MDAMPLGYQQTGVFLHRKAVKGLELQLASDVVAATLRIKNYTLRYTAWHTSHIEHAACTNTWDKMFATSCNH